MSHSQQPAPFADVDPWGLDDFAARFRQTIEELEHAWRRGTHGLLLREPRVLAAVGPDVVAVYRRMPSLAAARRDPRRHPAVEQLLQKLTTDALRTTRWGDLEPLPDGRFRAYLPDAPDRVLRRDQVDAARFWGIGLVLPDVDAHAELVHDQVQRAVRDFARDLGDLQRILRRRSALGIPLVPSHGYRRFEHLVHDVLNESDRHAERAPLSEDFCQATDLRVRYADLDRSRGARVQIKATADPDRHAEWLAHTTHQDLLVIVSPVTLAEAIESAPLDPAHRDVWACLDCEPENRRQLAYALRRTLFRGFERPDADPLGPLAAVPAPLRDFVRGFVRQRAFATTAALRRREAERGRYRTGRDGRIVWRSAVAS